MPPGGLRISPDGQKMAVLNRVHLPVLDFVNPIRGEDVNLEDPSLLVEVRHSWTSPEYGVAFSSDLRRLAVMARETVAVWDLATGKQLSRQSPDISPQVNVFLAFADDGRLSV